MIFGNFEKLDDLFGGKGVCRPPFVHCTPMCRRLLGVVVFLLIVAGMALLVCCAYWVSDLRRWYSFKRGDATGGLVERSGVDSFLLLRERERASYDHLLRNILHPGAPCLTLEEFGGRRMRNEKLDGDKVVCLEPGPGLSKECIVYSFGVANEWSFEESIRQKFGCQVFAFDPSMGISDQMHAEGIHFYDAGIGQFDENIKVNNHTWKMRSLDSILKQLGHENRIVDVLKMDIEGAEFVVLEDILAKGLLNRVNHLCVELHLLDNPYWAHIDRLLKRMEEEAGLRHFSTRNNTQMPPMRVPGFYSRREQHYFEMAWYRL